MAALAISALLVACCSGFISRLIYPDPEGPYAFEGPDPWFRGIFRVGVAIFIGLLGGIALVLFRRSRAGDAGGSLAALLTLIALLIAGPLGGVFGYYFLDLVVLICADACRVF